MLSSFFSHRCALCDSTSHSVLCGDCVAQLPYIKTACKTCALPSQVDVDACGHCLNHPHVLTSAHAVLRYEAHAQWLMLQYKYHKAFYLQACLHQLLTEYIQTHSLPEVDAILPMPMHARRWLGKGQNHASILARSVADTLGVPIVAGVVKKIKHTPRFATGQSKKERAQLIKNAFKVVGDVPARVLIVDDVMTTGASCEALAQSLKTHGAHEVHALVVARVA